MIKLSVIIPIYGVEKYIERCARSLFEQELDDVEFIFIDDCTLDNSIMILQSIVDEYRLKIEKKRWIIRLERMSVNSGLPAVRKYGIGLARGEYVLHVDSDDWIEPGMLSEMWKRAHKEDLDLVVCDYYKASESHKEYKVGGEMLEMKTFFYDIFINRYSWALWNKLFKRTVYNNPAIIYPQDNIGEDMALTLQLLRNCHSYCYVDKPFYNYFVNMSSMTRHMTMQKVETNLKQWVENINVLEEYYRNCDDKKVNDSIVFIKLGVKNYLLPYSRQPHYYCLWKSTFSEINKKVLLCPLISWRKKIGFVLTYLKLNPLSFLE